jgi:hypothetical protein
MGQAGPREIVDVPSPADEEARIFEPLDRLADEVKLSDPRRLT